MRGIRIATNYNLHCNILQHALQHTRCTRACKEILPCEAFALQHTATRTATHCNMHCNTQCAPGRANRSKHARHSHMHQIRDCPPRARCNCCNTPNVSVLQCALQCDTVTHTDSPPRARCNCCDTPNISSPVYRAQAGLCGGIIRIVLFCGNTGLCCRNRGLPSLFPADSRGFPAAPARLHAMNRALLQKLIALLWKFRALLRQ